MSSIFRNNCFNRASNPVWGEKLPFGTLCGEFSAGGWVHSVAFSPSGNTIAFCAHDSSVYIANGPNNPVQVIQTTLLPFVSLIFANENSLVLAGHDCAPFVATNNGREWYITAFLNTGL